MLDPALCVWLKSLKVSVDCAKLAVIEDVVFATPTKVEVGSGELLNEPSELEMAETVSVDCTAEKLLEI